jgi:hypothetical protein
VGEIPERVRVESNHRARLRRALLYSPELRTLGRRTGLECARGRPTGLEPAPTRATTGRSVLLSYSLHAWVHRRVGALEAWATEPSGPMRSRTSISGPSGRRLYRISYRTRSRATSGDGGDRTRITAVQTPRSPVELHPHERAGQESNLHETRVRTSRLTSRATGPIR